MNNNNKSKTKPNKKKIVHHYIDLDRDGALKAPKQKKSRKSIIAGVRWRGRE